MRVDTTAMATDDIIGQMRSAGDAEDVERLLARLPRDDLRARSLAFYLEHWLHGDRADDAFHPGEFLSEDLTAVMCGRCPVIFEGSNKWNEKPYTDRAHVEKSVERLIRTLKARLKYWSGKRIFLIVVPEKDTVLDKLFYRTGRFAEIDHALSKLEHFANAEGIGFCYDRVLNGMTDYLSEEDFTYADTHLPPRLYLQIFSRAISYFGLSWDEIKQRLQFREVDAYGDLWKKFDKPFPGPYKRRVPLFRDPKIELIDGNTTFSSPLGDTWQKFVNADPISKGSLMVFGDSHSSILVQNRLTYYFSGVFSEGEFYWNPLGLREPTQSSGADYIILEISQRFVF